MGLRMGIDLGGTKIEVVVLDADGGERLRRRIATPQGDYRATVGAVAALVEAAEAELGCRCTVGVGTPGSLSSDGARMRNANSTCLNGQPLLRDLQSLLLRELRIANDADCLALSEARDGAAAGAASVFAVILGTGVGGGIALGGELLRGANGIAGEWGHNPLPLPDLPASDWPACYCGRRGCIETYLSGPGLIADHQRETGRALAPPQIFAGAEAGDAACEASLQRYEARLARSLGTVINLLDPEVIVLGGGLSNLHRLYANVPRLWGEAVFCERVGTRLLKSRHGDSSGVRGAASLWPA